MVKHIVIWKIRNTANQREKLENMAEMKSRLLGLKEQIQEIKKLEVHFNALSAPLDNYDVILETEFDSWADLEFYQKHPLHAAVAEYVKNIRETRAAIDYEF